MNLYERFAALRKRVGGYQEQQRYAFTMRPTAAELNHIAEPSPQNRRIIAEVSFAMQLMKYEKADCAGLIDAALTALEESLAGEGVLTASACARAERALLPLSELAKGYEVIYAGHAHIDMNWMWGWQETVAVTLSTFRTVLNLMEEYPEFTFSQSQASVYRIVEEYDPDMMEEIKARIREGRWEVTASAWVETDKNMPDTESLIRHIGLTRAYLRDVWGVPEDAVKVDFSPDTFGHSRFVPEINGFGGVPYYYHCRGLQQDVTLYRYRAPSGSEVLVYKEPYWYNSGITPESGIGALEMERRCNGLKTALIVYGVGDHGGGPTRRDIEAMLEMRGWPVFPALRFGRIHDYFAKAEAVREGLPVVDHELNAIFSGCYTTQSRIKMANRRTEAALLDSERMAALASMSLGAKFPAARYAGAWEKVLFTHFHDILTGSGVQETREYAMGLLAGALATAQTEQAKAFRGLSEAVDTSMFPADDCIRRSRSEGAGVGFGIAHYAGVPNPERGAGLTRVYTVFNSAPVRRRELVEITLWDYAGDLSRLEAVDHEGSAVPLQQLDPEPVSYWDHRYVRVLLAADVPAMGYAVYALREKPADDMPVLLMEQDREELPKGPIVLENERLKASFDTGSGMLKSLVDKSDGRELIGGDAGLYLVRTQDSSMSSWLIGRYLGMDPVTDTGSVTVESGPLRSSVTFEQRVMHSTAKVTVSLDRGAAALHYRLEVDWHETCQAQDWNPLLTFRLPLKERADSILTDVPAGWAQRPARDMDVPALTGACAVSDAPTAALITDCKYGYRLAEGTLSASLINTSSRPDPYPERGIHAINLFVALTDGDPTHLKRDAEALIRPLTAVPTAAHAGKLPPRQSLLGFEAAHSVMTSAQIAPDGALALRLYEAGGAEDAVAVTVPFPIGRAELTDLDGRTLARAATDGRTARFTVGAHRIAQLKLYP